MDEPRIGSLCTGYGGLDLAALAVFGGELAWWSDIEPGPIKLMTHHHPGVPNLGDLKLVDWLAVREIEILTAGYPCQPFSNAGKRLGTEDPRHIWPWIADAIGVLRPRIVLLENVAAHLRRGFDVVSADLADLGYCVTWGIVSAAEAGAPHLRKRLYVVAEDTDQQSGIEWRSATPGEAESGRSRPDAGGRSLRAVPVADPLGEHERGFETGDRGGESVRQAGNRGRDTFDWRQYGPAIRRWEDILGVPAPEPTHRGPRGGVKVAPAFAEWLMGVPGRITSVPNLSINDQLRLAGNGVVPQQARLAILELLGV